MKIKSMTNGKKPRIWKGTKISRILDSRLTKDGSDHAFFTKLHGPLRFQQSTSITWSLGNTILFMDELKNNFNFDKWIGMRQGLETI